MIEIIGAGLIGAAIGFATALILLGHWLEEGTAASPYVIRDWLARAEWRQNKPKAETKETGKP